MINLSQIPPPDVVEPLDFESVLAERKAKLLALYPDAADALERESSPVLALLQESAYRELHQRQRINEAARAVMLASAAGADLDQLAANLGVQRLVIDAGDASAVPPVEPTLESDAELRERCILSLEALNTAGSRGSYVFHARSASGDVLDANAVSPLPGHVTVYVLSRTGTGAASEQLLAAVTAALSSDDVRPLTDNVSVLSASIVPYQITATLNLEAGPDAETVRTAASTAAQAYADETHKLGKSVGLAGIYAALKRPGVLDVDLVAPAARIAISAGQAAYCTGITLTVEVADG